MNGTYAYITNIYALGKSADVIGMDSRYNLLVPIAHAQVLIEFAVKCVPVCVSCREFLVRRFDVWFDV